MIHTKFHLVEGFQRRRLKCEKLEDDRRRTPSDGKSSRCLWQGELKRITTECTKNRDEKRTDDRICNRII